MHGVQTKVAPERTTGARREGFLGAVPSIKIRRRRRRFLPALYLEGTIVSLYLLAGPQPKHEKYRTQPDIENPPNRPAQKCISSPHMTSLNPKYHSPLRAVSSSVVTVLALRLPHHTKYVAEAEPCPDFPHKRAAPLRSCNDITSKAQQFAVRSPCHRRSRSHLATARKTIMRRCQ